MARDCRARIGRGRRVCAAAASPVVAGPGDAGRAVPGRFAPTPCFCCRAILPSVCDCRSIRCRGLRQTDEDVLNEVDPSAPRDPLPPHPGQRVQPASPVQREVAPVENSDEPNAARQTEQQLDKKSKLIKTAMCVEPRNGTLHVFMPPTERLEDYLDLVTAVEETAKTMDTPIVLEGYLPPQRSPPEQHQGDAGPGGDRSEHASGQFVGRTGRKSTTALYEEAFLQSAGDGEIRLGWTAYGNGWRKPCRARWPHAARQPFSAAARFAEESGRVIGTTTRRCLICSPAASSGRRVRHRGWMKVGGMRCTNWRLPCEQVPDALAGNKPIAAWLVDRIFRNLLVDLTGNTHRAEFCIDKLYSPDSSTGRLGLVEFRGFEMPPHARMSLTQQLLLRSLVARFWEQPYERNSSTGGRRCTTIFCCRISCGVIWGK